MIGGTTGGVMEDKEVCLMYLVRFLFHMSNIFHFVSDPEFTNL